MFLLSEVKRIAGAGLLKFPWPYKGALSELKKMAVDFTMCCYLHKLVVVAYTMCCYVLHFVPCCLEMPGLTAWKSRK